MAGDQITSSLRRYAGLGALRRPRADNVLSQDLTPFLRDFIFAVVFAAVVSACAPIRESQPAIAIYMKLQIGELAASGPAVRIIDIQKVGESNTRDTPSSGTRNLWLREGDYQATLECLRPYTDKYNADILKRSSPADSDGQFRFTIKFQADRDDRFSGEDHFYRLDCAVSADGKPAFVVMPLSDVWAT